MATPCSRHCVACRTCWSQTPHPTRRSDTKLPSVTVVRRSIQLAVREGSNLGSERTGLVERNQRAGVTNLYVPSMGEQLGEAPAVFGRHDTVVLGPDDDGRPVELAQVLRGVFEDMSLSHHRPDGTNGVRPDGRIV